MEGRPVVGGYKNILFYAVVKRALAATASRKEGVAKRLIKVATATRDMDVPANREGPLTVAI
jgi:hypothetical protein